MFGSEILEVGIGLVFVFLVASLAASAAREMIEAVLKTRAIQLERGIRQLLEDPKGTGATKELFDHPLLFGLFPGIYDPDALKKFILPSARATRAENGAAQSPLRQPVCSNLPTYIPSRNFALALMHVVAGGDAQGGVLDLEGLKATALALPDGQIRKAMLTAVSEAGQDLGRVRTSLEAWFDSNMDRVSGWYKRETQWILLALGLLLAVALNIDSINIVGQLAANNKLRQDIVAQATKTVEEINKNDQSLKDDQTLNESKDDLKRQLQGLSQLIGWRGYDEEALRANSKECHAVSDAAAKTPATKEAALAKQETSCRYTWPWWRHALTHVPGWLLTALAVSLGAPFWFDLLNKFMIIRSTVKPTQKSPSEGSDDRSSAVSPAEVLETAGGPPPPAPPPPVPALAAPEPQIVTIRLAIDLKGLNPDSLVLRVDRQRTPVPPDGFVDVALSVDRTHTLLATAKLYGRSARWSASLFPNLNDEGLPLSAELSVGSVR